jgi:hypothetical protein
MGYGLLKEQTGEYLTRQMTEAWFYTTTTVPLLFGIANQVGILVYCNNVAAFDTFTHGDNGVTLINQNVDGNVVIYTAGPAHTAVWETYT